MRTVKGSLSGCALLLVCAAVSAGAQTRSRLPQIIDNSAISRIPGTVHPLVANASDAGRADAAQPMDRMLLVLKSSDEQNSELEALIADQHNPGSPLYQQWLTPEQFGERFGPSADDVDTIAAWLEDQGFQVSEVAQGRRTIEFSGTTGQVESAFHTEMHRYTRNGESHIANSTDIALPSALTEVVAGIESLSDFRSAPLSHLIGPAKAKAGPARLHAPGNPQYTVSSTTHELAPGDFATIYDLNPLYSAGIDGTGQTIAVVGRTNFNLSDVTTFRSTFGLPAKSPKIIVNGANPGIVSQTEEVETLLDVQWAGAIAKGATIDFVRSANSTTSGDALSSQYIVNNNLAPVMTSSFGLCESLLSTSNQFYSSLWQQAASQGISVIVATGDSGSAGCDSPLSKTGAAAGFGVNGIASTPYNTAVGGTQLNEGGSPSA